MRRLVEKLKQHSIINNKKRILKNYYSKQMRKGKTYRASLVDRILFIIIFYLSIMIVLFLRTENLLLSFYMSAITSYFVIMTLYKIYKRQSVKKTNMIREDLKREKFIKKINNLSDEGFINYVKDVFEKYYKTELEYKDYPIDLGFTAEDEEYKIKCLKVEDEDKLTIRDISSYFKEIKNNNLNDGIIVTNSFFRQEVKDYTNILIYDLEKIIDMSKKTNLYPSNYEIEEYIIDNFIENRNQIKSQIKTINKNKIIKIYSISIIFYIFSYAVGYKTYYKIMSLSTFIIAVILSAYKFSEYIIIKDKSPFI